MISIGTVDQNNWLSDIVATHAPRDAKYFAFVPASEAAWYDLAHDAMLGLALQNLGSGVLAIRNIAKDYFFDRPMVGLFV